MEQPVFPPCRVPCLRDQRVHGLEAGLSQLEKLVSIRQVTVLHALLTHLE